MKRTTLMLPDDLASLLDHERRRLDVSAAEVVRRALRAYLGPTSTAGPPAFIGIGRSGGGNIAEEAEGILARVLSYENLMGRELANAEDRSVVSPADAESQPEATNGLGTEAVVVVSDEVSA